MSQRVGSILRVLTLGNGTHDMEPLDQLLQRVNANARLVWRGRYVDTTFLLEVGEVPWLIKVNLGRIVSVTRGPFVMPAWSFALRAPRADWEQFCLANPPPGFS